MNTNKMRMAIATNIMEDFYIFYFILQLDGCRYSKLQVWWIMIIMCCGGCHRNKRDPISLGRLSIAIIKSIIFVGLSTTTTIPISSEALLLPPIFDTSTVTTLSPPSVVVEPCCCTTELVPAPSWDWAPGKEPLVQVWFILFINTILVVCLFAGIILKIL